MLGTAWFDDFSFSINGKKVEQVEASSPFTRSQINWLEAVSYPLSSVDASKPGDTPYYDDLAPFGEMVRDAQIIALGEATHGTSEFFRMKHRILQYCVLELGVRIFAIEDNQLVVQRVNRYIAGGDGDARSSMYGMFGVWQTEEVHDLIQWLRSYNDSHRGDKVHFVGFDIQNLTQPMDSLYAFLNRMDVILYKDASSLLEGLKQQGANSYAVTDSVKLKWFQNAETVLEILSNHKAEWLAHAKNQQDSMDIYWGIQYATLVKQYAENTYKGHLSLYRDAAMAENISWILTMNQPASRMVIWAHNNHISRGDHPDDAVNIYNGISMGSWLSKKYGDKFKAFELSTYTGAYWAQVSYSNFKMMSCPLYEAPRGSMDEALHRISEKRNTDLLLLDLKNGRNQQWLTQPLPERFANHVNIEYGYWTKFSVPFQYDGVFFIDTTSPAKSYVK